MPNDLTGDVIEPALGQQVLYELADLNSGFISLLSNLYKLAGNDAETILAMPVTQTADISRLTTAATRRLTNCAFALFDLRLEDTVFWMAVRTSPTPAKYRDCSFDDRDLQRQICLFTLCALMYVRHLTRVNRFLGGLSFGAHPNALDAIVNMTLNQLRDVADNCPGLLCCRLGKNPQAWSDLLKLARRNDGQPLLPAKILGYQHAYFDHSL